MYVAFILFLVISPVRFSHQSGPPPATEEENPFLSAAKSFLEEAIEKNPDIVKNSGMGALSGIMQLMKNSDGKQISDMLSGLNVQGGGKNVASDILSGIASMLDKNSQGFDPSLLTQVADVLSNVASEKSNEIPGSGSSSPDWGSILGMAGNLISSMNDKKGEGGSLEGFLNLLPMLSGNAPSGHVHFADKDLEDSSEHEKSQHSSYMPPFMHLFYEFWEHFKKSEFGEAIWKKSGLESIFMLFVDKEGYFQVDRIFESMENASFRRKWIKSLSSFVGEWIKHLSDAGTQARYTANLKYYGNSFLKAQGYPKSVYFDTSKPTESAIIIIDAVLKKNFGLSVNSGKYIRPAAAYINEVFKLKESQSLFNMKHLSSYDISSKMAEILNGDLIEPVLRVWKAYKFSLKNPQCDRRLICYLNKKNPKAPESGLKPGVLKLSSIIASWYLSGRTGTPFWKLYNAATEDLVCEAQYPADCQRFFDEDLRFTTESIHSEEL